jgi:hypothetical protein
MLVALGRMGLSPKKRKKKKKKRLVHPLGPKASLGSKARFQGIGASRHFSELRLFQEGKISMVGASFSMGAVKMV